MLCVVSFRLFRGTKRATLCVTGERELDYVLSPATLLPHQVKRGSSLANTHRFLFIYFFFGYTQSVQSVRARSLSSISRLHRFSCSCMRSSSTSCGAIYKIGRILHHIIFVRCVRRAAIFPTGSSSCSACICVILLSHNSIIISGAVMFMCSCAVMRNAHC